MALFLFSYVASRDAGQERHPVKTYRFFTGSAPLVDARVCLGITSLGQIQPLFSAGHPNAHPPNPRPATKKHPPPSPPRYNVPFLQRWTITQSRLLPSAPPPPLPFPSSDELPDRINVQLIPEQGGHIEDWRERTNKGRVKRINTQEPSLLGLARTAPRNYRVRRRSCNGRTATRMAKREERARILGTCIPSPPSPPHLSLRWIRYYLYLLADAGAALQPQRPRFRAFRLMYTT